MSAPVAEGDPRRWLILGTVSMAVFIAVMDISIVNIALPSIVRDLHTTFGTATWVLNAYNLVFAVLLVTAGRLADLYGRRIWFLAGTALFGVASLACALSPSIGALIGFRVVQGAAAAIMLPVALALVVLAFPPRERGTAIGIWGAVAAGAAAAGPPLGGVLTEYISWHWIFGVNVPVCALALAVAWRVVPESRDTTASGAIDWAGIVTLSGSLFALTLGLVEGSTWGWGSARVVSLLIVSAVAMAAFLIAERTVAEPILDLNLFRVPAFARACTSIVLLSIGLIGATYALAVLFQAIWAYSPIKASLVILPFSVGAFLAGPIAGRISDHAGVRVVAVPGLVLFGAGVLAMASLGTNPAPARGALLAALAGIGVGMSFPPLLGGAMATVPGSRAGVASGVTNVVRQVGFVVGVALVEAIVQTKTGLDPTAFSTGFLACGASGLAAAAVALAIPRTRPIAEVGTAGSA